VFRRSVVIFTLSSLALCAASASAAPKVATGISPGLVHQGQRATITAPASRVKISCNGRIHYADGAVQTLSAKRPRNGHVSWTVTVPTNAAVGQGTWQVACGKVLVAFGSVVVVPSKSTPAADAPRVTVAKQGFSQKPDPYGTGSHLSYGLILHNTSETQDAENVYVIVNMVTASGVLVGSVSKTIPLVAAGLDYAYGDSLGLRTQVPAVSLEITIRVGAHEPKKERLGPDFANVRIVPSDVAPGFVSEVDGEVVNDNSKQTLMSASLSIVVLDASGLPVGGGTGYSTAALPPGSRFVFTAQGGFDAIPLERAATVLISTQPTYGPAL